MFVKQDGKMMWINREAATKETGYEHPSTHKDERCQNCSHFEKPNECSGPKMIELSDRPKLPDGNVHVSPFAWCRFYEKK
jgi:hypothetical protein